MANRGSMRRDDQWYADQVARTTRWKEGTGLPVAPAPIVAPQLTLLELRTLTFALGMPPSVNALYGINAKTGAKFLLEEQRTYRSDVIYRVRRARGSERESPLLGRLRMNVTFFFENRRRTDISNRLKALEDALTHAGAYHDDSQIDEEHVYRVVGDVAEGCHVQIEEIGK